MEVLVVLASLGMILWMAGQLLFPMQQAAERQRLQVEARQTARGATDYAAMLLRGATDMNDLATPRNPAAVLPFLVRGSITGPSPTYPTCDGSPSSDCIQISYNNVTDASLAAPGTDILSFGVPAAPTRLKAAVWPSNGQDSSSPTGWEFDQGCPSDAGNQAAFDRATGRDPVSGWSQPLMLFDSTGSWVFYQITDYKDTQNNSTCTSPSAAWCTDPDSGAVVPCMQVVANPGNGALSAPGGQRNLTNPVTLIIGLQYTALRVCNGWLEQKVGTFDPATDNNCPALAAGAPFPPYVTKAGWSPLLPNVEDLQFAYLFDAGAVGNGPGGTMTTAAGVPIMGGRPLDPQDIQRIIGIRVTVTARSSLPVFRGGKMPMPRPAAEDHTPALAADTYFRCELSSTSLLRNRLTGF
jgi:hypothetical protein